MAEASKRDRYFSGGAARVDQGEDEPAEGAERGEDGAFHPALLDPEAMGAERANAPAK